MHLKLLAAVVVLVSIGATAEPSDGRPNILFCIADDWGWPHAGAYGDPVVKTPTFDRLAAEGILFRHAYVTSPSCAPSRASIVTGQWHWRLEEAANLYGPVRRKFRGYPDALEEAGYFVGYSRKGWGPGGLADRARNPAGTKYRNFSQFLEKRPEGKPFCFWFGSSDPHRGYAKGSGKKSGMDLAAITLPACFPDSPEVRSDVADYYWEVQRFDREVGERLEKLKELGELDNTVVVMTGDHGMPFPRCKGNLYDTGTRVPLVIRWSGVVEAGRTIGKKFVSLADLAPTFLEIAEVKPFEEMTGRSLLGLLKSGADSVDRSYILTGKERHVPCQEAPISGGTPMRAIRTDGFLYIRNYEPDRWPAGTPNWEKAFLAGSWYGDCDNGPTKTYMIDHREKDDLHQRLFAAAFSKRPAEELYDLTKDPAQLKNLAGDEMHEGVKKDLAARMVEALKTAGDPRASGGGKEFDAYPYSGGTPRHPDYRRKK